MLNSFQPRLAGYESTMKGKLHSHFHGTRTGTKPAYYTYYLSTSPQRAPLPSLLVSCLFYLATLGLNFRVWHHLAGDKIKKKTSFHVSSRTKFLAVPDTCALLFFFLVNPPPRPHADTGLSPSLS
jgi:hypothetical protein